MVIVSKSEVRKIHSIEKMIQKKFEKKDIPGGMEICEIQLFHLAKSIKDTKINHDIDPYLANINEVLESFSKEELIKTINELKDEIPNSKILEVEAEDQEEDK